eukprot:scaffold2417_cov155-Amphora_coffeaeformis.AAC.4
MSAARHGGIYSSRYSMVVLAASHEKRSGVGGTEESLFSSGLGKKTKDRPTRERSFPCCDNVSVGHRDHAHSVWKREDPATTNNNIAIHFFSTRPPSSRKTKNIVLPSFLD